MTLLFSNIDQVYSSSTTEMSKDVEMENEDLVFDPDQDPEEKRAVRQNYRALTKKFEEQNLNPNDFTPQALMNHVKQADALFKKVKEPQEAILDSRILLLASNASAQKVRSLKSGTGSFDVDEFVAKLATFMGGQKQVRQENFPQEAGSDVEEEDMHDYPLDWAKIGRKAMAKSRRAPAMSFMLGPLSLEQKKRANMKREKHEKNTAEEVKPQELKEEDIQRSENETTKNVHDLEELLGKHCTMEDESIEPVNLFKFILNPHSFAQSVENVFYLSFLIRDGRVALETNEHGEPVIYPCEAPSDADYAEGLKKNQLVLEFDMQVWKRAIEVFDIKEPMVPTRPKAKVKLGAWYG